MTQDGELPGVGYFVHPLDEETVPRLLALAEREGPVVVKTHHELTPLLRRLLVERRAKATFIHRDPRDMILSAMDHCLKSRGEAMPMFQQFSTIPASIQEAHWQCKISCDWIESGLACVFRYTDIVSNPQSVLARLSEYLGIAARTDLIEHIIQAERSSRAPGHNNFNVGALSRYPQEMSCEDIKLCNRKLGHYITQLD